LFPFPQAGALGHGNRNSLNHFTRVEALDGVEISKVACGKYHTFALSSEGSVFSWGEGEHGRLGLSGNADQFSPVEIDQSSFLGEKVVDVFAGGYHGAAITETGKLFTWGR
jgi:regulator of chromosome condensation